LVSNINAGSGIGFIGMNAKYFDTGPLKQNAVLWDMTQSPPDAVVINIGTNDGFAAPVFQAKYTEFLERLRAIYPNTAIVALRPFNGVYRTQILAAVSARKVAGDEKVTYVDTANWITSGTTDYLNGDTVHPSAIGHQKVAARLGPILRPLVMPNTYISWRSALYTGPEINSGIAEPLADFDKDSIPNLLEYSARLNPLVSDAAFNGPSVTVASEAGARYLQFSYTENLEASDLTYTPEVSSDLQTWFSGSSHISFVESSVNGYTRLVKVRDNSPLVGSSKRFMRLRVTQ
jgi:hypothetical protein